jgi:hypothetical protein
MFLKGFSLTSCYSRFYTNNTLFYSCCTVPVQHQCIFFPESQEFNAVLRIRIRCFFTLLHLESGSGMNFSGSRSRIPDPAGFLVKIFLLKNPCSVIFLNVKNCSWNHKKQKKVPVPYTIPFIFHPSIYCTGMNDPVSRRKIFRIRDKHPGSATLI